MKYRFASVIVSQFIFWLPETGTSPIITKCQKRLFANYPSHYVSNEIPRKLACIYLCLNAYIPNSCKNVSCSSVFSYSVSVNANYIEQSAGKLMMDVVNIAALQKVASAELTAGKMPEAVFAKFSSLGIPADMITDGLSNLSHDRSAPYFQTLNDFLENRNKALQEKTKSNIWDPLNDAITSDKIPTDYNQNLYHKYLLNPGRIRRNLYLLALFPFVAIIALFFLYDTTLSWIDEPWMNGIPWLLLPFALPYIYIKNIYGMQPNLIRFVVASTNDWVFSPDFSDGTHGFTRALRMTGKFREILEGDVPALGNEWWGTFKSEQQTVPFWAGFYINHTSTSGKGYGKGWRRTKLKGSVYAIKLDTKLKTSFWLKPDNVLKSFFFQFRTKKIDVESAAFNRHFEVYYNGNKVDRQLEIVKILSPAVQVKLLELRNIVGPYTMLFKSDIVFFMHDGELLKEMRTDFFKKVEVAEEDKFALEKRLKQIFAISGDIIPYLD